MNETPNALDRGTQTIKSFAKSLPQTAGVYRMIDAQEKILYIGKAKNLQRRVLSYTTLSKLPNRLQRMVSLTDRMDVVHTKTEAEALLLEANMIRHHKPLFNILLRDDKTVPYIHISKNHDFPRLTSIRGQKNKKNGHYFGPFISSSAVYQTIDAAQKVFQLRNCTDSYFDNRNRPCLQYHIKRCSAPCVGKISAQDYAAQVDQAMLFLHGKNNTVREHLTTKMQEASDALDFERAALYRNQLQALAKTQTDQQINLDDQIGDVDVMACYSHGGRACIQVFFFRGGRNYGNQAYFPRHSHDQTPEDILSAFIGQFYQVHTPAKTIFLSHTLPDHAILEQALTDHSHSKVTLITPQRGIKKKLITQALDNAKQAHARHMADDEKQQVLLDGVAQLFDLPTAPQRIEVYDNSHISGTNPVGAMIVTGTNGFDKKAYRKFNIKSAIEPGDDYAMMREVLTRRFQHTLKDSQEDPHKAIWPDLILIDGGKGQLSAALEVMTALDLDHLPVVAISKGIDRNAGREQFHMRGKDSFQLPLKDPVLYFLQNIRDEAHRFAIGTHRTRRKNALSHSRLDDIPGIGAGRKKALIRHFGSAKGVESAAIEDLASVSGISRNLAGIIYNFFHKN